MALSTDRNTPRRDGDIITVPVAASTKIHGGSIVARNAAGNAVKGASTAGLVYLGRAENEADNSSGAVGAIDVAVRRGVFRWSNHATSTLTKAHVGDVCYIADDETVAKYGSHGRSPAGLVVAVDEEGVWVEAPRAPAPHIISVTNTIDFSSINANGHADHSVTVTGAVVGDAVAIGLPAAPLAGLIFSAFVSAADTVKVRAHNYTSSSKNAATASYRVSVIKS